MRAGNNPRFYRGPRVARLPGALLGAIVTGAFGAIVFGGVNAGFRRIAGSVPAHERYVDKIAFAMFPVWKPASSL